MQDFIRILKADNIAEVVSENPLHIGPFFLVFFLICTVVQIFNLCTAKRYTNHTYCFQIFINRFNYFCIFQFFQVESFTTFSLIKHASDYIDYSLIYVVIIFLVIHQLIQFVATFIYLQSEYHEPKKKIFYLSLQIFCFGRRQCALIFLLLLWKWLSAIMFVFQIYSYCCWPIISFLFMIDITHQNWSMSTLRKYKIKIIYVLTLDLVLLSLGYFPILYQKSFFASNEEIKGLGQSLSTYMDFWIGFLVLKLVVGAAEIGHVLWATY